MQPLNPFLCAFFKSSLPSQCSPVHHHILLVPTTEVLLTSRDRESGASYADFAGSEDFLGSHVLRVPAHHAVTAGGKDVINMRESRGKAKQYTTVNGRTVVVKDNYVYSNKGFKTLNQAQLLTDKLYYHDSLEPRQWLVYYISRPLVGIFEDVKIIPASLPKPRPDGRPALPARAASHGEAASSSLPKKKDIKTFNDLLNNFPMIARQMQPGLEKLFKEFNVVFDKPLPPPPSANVIPDPIPEGPIAAAMKKARTNSSNSALSTRPNGHTEQRAVEDFYAEDDEDVMRGALETAVTTAIDLFQMVDKQQLSLLGATTDLTGPVVERLIERYVTEQVHDSILYPRLCAMKRLEDHELESRIRQMEFVDISQVGILIQGGQKGKHELTLRLGRAVDEFRKLGVAGSPQQMMDILLLTLKTVTQLADVPKESTNGELNASDNISPVLTINADTLVSLLLVVVIRAQVRYLQARLLYMRHFIFIDDVESGEMGYALSTFEAVLSYLARDSGGLRKASRRNHKLWQATRKGEIKEMQNIMEPDRDPTSADEASDDVVEDEVIDEHNSWNYANGYSRRSSIRSAGRLSQASTLNHVFPWQNDDVEAEEEDRQPPFRRKTVTLDTRSMSSRSMSTSSEVSFRSRATTVDSTSSGIEGDTSIVRLSQTEDSFGESIPMMAIQYERPESLKYLLTLRNYYPLEIILGDTNNEGTTLLSAAVQLGHTELIDIILDFIYQAPETIVIEYLEKQDVRGRSVAHYLFNAPALIPRVGRLLPWRQKDRNGQTPLFALCRSYDHNNYKGMVEAGLLAATSSQGDGEALHLDDHVDAKGNTLLHIVNDAQVALRILLDCDSDPNATNDKKFTALMVASKYGRLEMVRVLFGDPRVDLFAKELRGLTAVELAKDDDVRNRIDDLILFSGQPAADGRITSVVRSFFVEDATIRLVLKSGAPSKNNSFTVTTCRRSLADFEHLAKLLAVENPASWLPSISGLRSPFQFPAKPSRAVLKDIQVRLDSFLKTLLSHSTFSTHEMLWEFFLVPDIQAEQMDSRSQLKAETRMEKVRDELEPIEDLRDVEQFVDHAREMVRSVNYSTKSVARRANMVQLATTDFFDSSHLLTRAFSTLDFVPQTHISALEAYVHALTPSSTSPHSTFHTSILSIHSTIIAMLLSLSRPTQLIQSITTSQKAIERSFASLSRSTRWPLGLLDETRQRLNEEKEDKVKRGKEEVEGLGKELRYTQQVVAGELAGWQDLHEKMGRRAVRDLVRGCLVVERGKLEGLKRAVRKLKLAPSIVAPATKAAEDEREEVVDAPPPIPEEILNGDLIVDDEHFDGVIGEGSDSERPTIPVLEEELASDDD